MKTTIKRFARSLLWNLGYDVSALEKYERSPRAKYSNLDEEKILVELLKETKIKDRYCVDIGANDGIRMSNTRSLFLSGWRGLAVDCDGRVFARLSRLYKDDDHLNLCKCLVTPETIGALLTANQVPREFGVLNIDIDGYDYHVLDRLLQAFRPAIICAEINEIIPPPIRFSVSWDPRHSWAKDHFFGQSITQVAMLCDLYSYKIVKLEYNNVFLLAREASGHLALTPEDAYEQGYRGRSDRKERFPWNADAEPIYSLGPEDALKFLDYLFARYQGKYTLSL